MEATNAIINAIEATNATVDQLVQQGNELCDDVDNLRAADERLLDSVQTLRADVEANKKDLAGLRGSFAADKEHISANKEAIASQAKDLAELRAAVADLRSGLANDVVNLQAIVEAQAKEIAELRAAISAAKTDAPATPANADTPDMAALIARIPKPDAVRTRAAAAQPVETPAQTVEVVEQPAAPAPAPAPRKDPVVPKPAAKTVTNAVETRAYARQYMIENGAKVEQLRDPAAIEATVKSDAFAAWLAAR